MFITRLINAMNKLKRFYLTDFCFVLLIQQYGRMMLRLLLWNNDKLKEEVRIFWLLGHDLHLPRRFTGIKITTKK